MDSSASQVTTSFSTTTVILVPCSPSIRFPSGLDRARAPYRLDGCRIVERGKVAWIEAEPCRPDDPTHDLARARLRQRRDDRDRLRLQRLAELLDDPAGDRRPELDAIRLAPAQGADDDDRLALDGVGHADRRGFDDRWVGCCRGLDLGRSDPLARDLQRVVRPATDVPVAVGVDGRP